MNVDPALEEAGLNEWRRRSSLFEAGVTVRRALDSRPPRPQWWPWWEWQREPWGTRWLFVFWCQWTLMLGLRRSDGA